MPKIKYDFGKKANFNIVHEHENISRENSVPLIIAADCLYVTVFAIYCTYAVGKVPVLVERLSNLYPLSLCGRSFEIIRWHWA